jgi:predicted nucleic acid-binding protein
MKAVDSKTYVVDASWEMLYLLPDEANARMGVLADKLFQVDANELVAPPLLPFEVGNALKMSVKRNRISEKLASIEYKKYFKMPIKYLEVDWDKVLKFSIKNNLNYYDGVYVWLALEKKAELLTLDEEMKKVWERLRVN